METESVQRIENNGETDLTRRIQMLELDIYKQVKRLCDENGLRYFAIGGTCIGAVRHKGFIPWDDDIDIAMPYEDYAKLRQIAKEQLPEPYEVYDPDEHQHFLKTFYRVQNADTAYIDKRFKSYKDRYMGVFIDILPIYGTPEDEKELDKMLRRADSIQRKNRFRRFPMKLELGTAGRIFWLINLPNKVFHPFNYFTKKAEEEFGRYKFGESSWIFFGWRIYRVHSNKGMTYKCTFSYEDFKDYIEMPFVDTTIRVPVGYDSYLTREFGDYMTLPPEEKRKAPHPTALIDLDRSYKEYAKEGV
ncbi:MAG: LicD family protein [Oscillospiraceae bacterium]|nr:LicD family protein [Oscillospiraceae bacterium]